MSSLGYTVYALAGVGIFFILNNALNIYYNFKNLFSLIMTKRKMFKELKAKKDKLLANGETHKWVEVTAPDNKSKIIVCEKTGWVPSKNGFLPLASVEALKSADKMEKDYSDFKEKRMKEIAESNGLSVDQLESIYTDVVSIKKDFTLNNINNFLSELKK